MEDRLIFDWLSVTFDFDDVGTFLQFIGFDSMEFIDLYGMYGYQKRFYYEGVSIHYDGGSSQGVWLDVSGQGCRTLEALDGFDWHSFLTLISASGYVKNFTRLDIAFDDFSGLLLFDDLIPDTQNRNYVSKFSAFEILQSSEGSTVYHGSKKSDIRFRIYDKGAQMSAPYHWTRFEIQLRDAHAMGAVENYIAGYSVSTIFFGVINNYLRYITPDASRKERCTMAEYWQRFLQSEKKITLLSKVDAEYSLSDLNNFVINQAGNSIKTFIEIFGTDAFLETLYEKPAMLSKKQQQLIEKSQS